MEDLPHIPSDIIIDIIPRLPVKSILRFKSVSKSWCRAIEDPSLADRHLSRANEEPGVLLAATAQLTNETSYYLLKDDVSKAGLLCSAALFGASTTYESRLLPHGSCNGLVCLVALKEDLRLQGFIWNLALQEYIILPTDSLQTMLEAPCLQRYKLAYSPPTKEYKVLYYGDQVMRIHTLGTCSWRDVLSVPPHPFYKNPVFADGSLHWRGNVEHCIISLDIGREEFYITNYPTLGSEKKCSIDLFEMGGCLAVADLSFIYIHIIAIWVLRDDENNTNKKQWVKVYILKTKPVDKLFKLTCWGGHPCSCASGFNFIGLWQQDKIFFECEEYYSGQKIYVYCDTKTDEMVPIMDLHFGGKSDLAIVGGGCYLLRSVLLKRKTDFNIVGACAYTRSLVSLKPYGAL